MRKRVVWSTTSNFSLLLGIQNVHYLERRLVSLGLGAGVWTRDTHEACKVPRAIKASHVWVNCPRPLRRLQEVWIRGRETYKMMLVHYCQTKNMLISYDKNKLGLY
mmetsp:Transcript_4126/g.8763  ORF Transcript_4126/g.8763 Transcript_4126/m.8763 type:complete len:106 (+) Transcript_4126:175-492(+)